jgi:hypothetical protein
MTTVNETERKNLTSVAVRTTAFLRDFCRKDGVPGLGDFLNGLIVAGTSLDQRLEGEGGYVEILREEIAHVEKIAQSKSFKEHEGELAGTKLGEVMAEKTSRSLIASVACEGRFIEVANELRVNKQAMLRMMAIGAIAVVLDDSASVEVAKQRLEDVERAAREKVEAVAGFAELSDDELFSDFPE